MLVTKMNGVFLLFQVFSADIDLEKHSELCDILNETNFYVFLQYFLQNLDRNLKRGMALLLYSN